ncbi:hypothetical protein OROMI_009463 [Orobanche minor]
MCPVHYTWLFPVERQLGEYKDSVTNKSAPEGCIVEAYLAWECVTYTKFYLGTVDPTPEPMSTIPVQFNLSIITNEVEVHGRLPDFHLQPHELGIAHWWILLNCPEVQYWKDIHLSCDAVNGDIRFHNETFADYFGQWGWFDTSPQIEREDNYGLLSVDTSTSWYEGDPFVFATPAKPIYYLDDLVKKGAWKIVNHVAMRNIYIAATLGQAVDKDDNEAYQEPDTTNIPPYSTILLNNIVEGRVVRLHGEVRGFIDVATN